MGPNQTAPRSSLFCVHAVCFFTELVSNVRQLFAADDFSRRNFQMHFFLALKGLSSFTGIIFFLQKIALANSDNGPVTTISLAHHF